MLPKTRKPEGSELSLPRQSEPPQACPMIETTVADDSELVSRPLNPCAPEQAQLLSGLAALVLHRQSGSITLIHHTPHDGHDDTHGHSRGHVFRDALMILDSW